jgi:hypothetical protein
MSVKIMNNNTPSKKLTYALIAGIVVIAAILVWFFFFSTPAQQQGIKGLFPFFGDNSSNPPTGSQEPGGNTLPDDIYTSSQGRQPILYQLHQAPVAGVVVFDRSKTPFARYIERGLGHVYETDLSTLKEGEVSIETIPGVQDAVWSQDGSSVATRRSSENDASTIESYALKIPSGTDAASKAVGTSLPRNIVAMASYGNNLFYIAKTSSGVVGDVATFSGTGTRQIFSSPFSEWLASWPSTNSILLATKPANNISGHVYTLNASSGALTRVLSNIPGITAVANSDASKIMYLQAQGAGAGYSMSIYNAKTQKTDPFNFFTMPEKCVWGSVDAAVVYCAIPDAVPQGTYPDDWYQGVVSFSDSLWRINTETGESARVIGLVDKDGNPMDATHLAVDSKDATLSFINKRDGSLWRVLMDQTAFGGFTPPTNDPTQPES